MDDATRTCVHIVGLPAVNQSKPSPNPIVFTGQTHHDLPHAPAEISADRENKVAILTGTGEVPRR